jgi:tripartite-type tricarboxylate transporter receptor subunit TctC
LKPSSIRRLDIALWAALCTLAAAAQAQTYPTKPVRFIVPFPPGAGNDILARAVALRLSDVFGQPVIVDNRPGGGGMLGIMALAKAAPDGHTIAMGSTSTLAINPAMQRKLPFDAQRDLAPISLLGSAPFILAVHPSVAATSVQELVALAKARPGALNYSSAGAGVTNHLAAEIFKSMTGADITHVPYKGATPAMFGAIAGEVQLTFGPMLSTLPHARSGKLRALGITAAERAAVAPEIPTIAESGVPGYEVLNWYGMVAPASTPARIVDRLHRETVQILNSKELKDRLTGEGAEVIGSTPARFAAFIKTETVKWREAVRMAKVAAQ